MQKNSIMKIILAIAAIVVAGFVVFGSKVNAPTGDNVVPPVLQISGNASDLVSISIKPGDAVNEGEVITGSLKGNYFFEANARGMLLDKDKNSMTQFPITATSDWMMEGAVDFKMTVSYVVDDAPITKGPGYLRIANDNPSGDPIRDKFIDIPVNFQ